MGSRTPAPDEDHPLLDEHRHCRRGDHRMSFFRSRHMHTECDPAAFGCHRLLAITTGQDPPFDEKMGKYTPFHRRPVRANIATSRGSCVALLSCLIVSAIDRRRPYVHE